MWAASRSADVRAQARLRQLPRPRSLAGPAEPVRQERSGRWRPGLLSFPVAFLAYLGLYALWDRDRSTSVIGWYTSIMWSLPLLISLRGIGGALLTAARLRRTGEACPPPAVADLLIVTIPTIGRLDTFAALRRVTDSMARELPGYFTDLRIDVVIEEGCEAGPLITALAAGNELVRIVEIPRSYGTPNGSRFKARANHYATTRRDCDGESRDDVWVLHMDDDTGVGPDTASALARFIGAQRSAGPDALHLGQGVLSYPRENAANRLTWLADSVRPGCDISLFQAGTGRGTPGSGLHGELLLIRASVEASIGWDFGPHAIVEDSEFALHFSLRYPGRCDWFDGRSYGASPSTVSDFIRQRERWVAGLLLLATKRSIPLRRRLLMLHNVILWATCPVAHPLVVLAVGVVLGDLDTTPAIVALVPVCGVNIAFCFWLYWEGLKINASSSLHPRRLWWEPLCLVLLLPVLSLIEVLGIFRGVLRFVRGTDHGFTVIAKPV